MIEIQLYRQRVGIFSGWKYHSKSYFSRHAPNQDCINGDTNRAILRMTFVVSLLVMLLAELEVQQLVVISISTSLKLSGDVESDPGPYEIIKSVHGSFNQDNIALFGGMAGRQCACNALFSISSSAVCGVCFWKSVDLDYILAERDKLYKSLRFQGYLNVEELPRQIKIFERTVNLEILEENLHDSIAVYGNSTYFFFDSHCRNSRGITYGEAGFSVLVNIDSLFQIERCIEEAFQLSGRVYPSYF